MVPGLQDNVVFENYILVMFNIYFQSFGNVMLPFLWLTTALFGSANTKDIFTIGRVCSKSLFFASYIRPTVQ